MKKLSVIFGIIVFIVSGVYLCAFTVSEREYVVLTQFGKPTGTIDASGLHFKRPGFLETINRIDRRTHVDTTQTIQLMLGDKNPIVLTCYICWRVSNPLLYFQSLGRVETVKQKLGDMVNSQLGGVLGEYTLQNIINTDASQVKIDQIEKQIRKNTNDNTMEKYGIEVVQLGIRRISYPRIVANAIYNRMIAERGKEAKKFRAEGKENAAKIEAKTNREITEMLAEAYKQSETLKGEGDKEAIRIYSEAYGLNKEFFEFTRSMEAYKEILKNKAVVVLSTDSSLFKYLNNPLGAYPPVGEASHE